MNMTNNKRKTDPTNAARQSRRRDALQLAAQVNGFANWSQLSTHIKNMAALGVATVNKTKGE